MSWGWHKIQVKVRMAIVYSKTHRPQQCNKKLTVLCLPNQPEYSCVLSIIYQTLYRCRTTVVRNYYFISIIIIMYGSDFARIPANLKNATAVAMQQYMV